MKRSLPWTELGTETKVPSDRLEDENRLLPSPVGVTDGRIAKVLSGAWAIGEDVEGVGGTAGAKVWRFEIVNGTGVHSEAVFIRLRYIDTYSNTGVRTAVSDLGNGYLTATGTRTISQNTALNLKVLLGLTSLVALMQLVTSLPSPGDANWGEFYGLSDTAGRVEDVYYRREVETTILDWRVERLSSSNRDLHGYAQVARGGVNGYSAGGSLFPSDEGIEELIEEQDSNGNVTIRAVVNDGGLLQSDISLILFYDLGDGGYVFSTAREVPLFHDASYTVAGQRRYVSAVATDFRFTPGRRYGTKWRNAGQAHDLVLSEGNHLVAVADHDDLESIRAEVLKDIYSVEDRVAGLESAPGGGDTAVIADSDIAVTTATWVSTGLVLPTTGYCMGELYPRVEHGRRRVRESDVCVFGGGVAGSESRNSGQRGRPVCGWEKQHEIRGQLQHPPGPGCEQRAAASAQSGQLPKFSAQLRAGRGDTVMSWRSWLGLEFREESNFTERLIQARLDAAGRLVQPTALGCVEAAAGLWSRAFAAAESDRLSAPMLGRIGRALLLKGEAVWVWVDGVYHEASSWDIKGRESWIYRCDLPMPSGSRTVNADARAVLHPRINADASRPWKGISPIDGAVNTATLAAAIEKSAVDTSTPGPFGHILPVPSIGTSTTEGEIEVNPLQNDINNLHGGVVVAETTAAGYGEGKWRGVLKKIG